MTPSNGTQTKTVQRTVFDLNKFDDVTLQKTVTLPAPATSIEEALAAVGNDKTRLMSVINEGLIAEALETARQSIEGFQVVDEDGTATPYEGKFADEAKGKLIGNAILSLAKINGYEKSLPADKKRELKDRATAFLRDNPAMLASLQS